MKKKLISLGALAIVALIAAGCFNGSAENGNVASGNSNGNSNTNHEQGIRFAECMRENGIGEFPDPDASGRLTVDGVVNGSKLDPTTAAWETAIAACRDLQPSGFTGDGERSAAEQEAALAFAECMRDNGVEDFPDPPADGPLIDTRRIPSAAGRGARSIPGFDAAAQKCRDAFAGELGLRVE